MLEGSCALTNDNQFTIADAEIICQITAPSGTVVGGYRFTILQGYRAQEVEGRERLQIRVLAPAGKKPQLQGKSRTTGMIKNDPCGPLR